MLIHSVQGQSALDAWKQGIARLMSLGGEAKNFITTITHPCNIDPSWLVDYSPHKFKVNADDARDVANTIFPLKMSRSSGGRADLYSRYLHRHDRAKSMRRRRHTWGTYFERLTRFPPTDINQLERVIEKLTSWPNRNTTGLVFHLSSPVVDTPRTRGGPCWHYGELLWNSDETLDLVVVYRNHDFFNKVLGNFIGLGHLLEFICKESGKHPGLLVSHSVHAYYDASQGVIRTMIEGK